MVPGAKWRGKDNVLGDIDKLAVVMAGFLIEEEDGKSVLVRPDLAKTVPLRLRRKENGGGAVLPKVVAAPTPAPVVNGVGFVDFGDDLDDDEELIDEDTLMDGDDLATPIQQRTTPPFNMVVSVLTPTSSRVPSKTR